VTGLPILYLCRIVKFYICLATVWLHFARSDPAIGRQFVVDNGSANLGPRRTNPTLTPASKRGNAYIEEVGLSVFSAMGVAEIVGGMVALGSHEKLRSAALRCCETWQT
jgi:hypothetical protein